MGEPEDVVDGVGVWDDESEAVEVELGDAPLDSDGVGVCGK